ncbi:ABC transporter [Mesorhizobium sp. IMUNJ 23033]|uniref:ABC transporter n=1 Tax=Mesorhizobium waimense TaxID=1300307 RepID=A0A3A5K1S7_9HYPH|nr:MULTISPECIES: ABC transporter [Mesorhizobium]RJT26609.1 ABC transporter [Mesorhizobium waimense]
MSRILIAMVAMLAVASLSGCANDWIGKGKGKAPPPEPAPVEQPVIK